MHWLGSRTNLTFPGLCVPPHVGPALALALAPNGEVGVADEVDVRGHAGGGGGAVLEWGEAGWPWRWLLMP